MRASAGDGLRRIVLIAAAIFIALSFAAAESPRLYTDEAYIEDVQSSAAFPLDDPHAAFSAIFARLPDRVKVLPTENYYYFSFFQRGVRYGGNFRLAASDRDAGKLHFAYFEDFAEWRPRPPVAHIVLDAADGVLVERAAPLLYRVIYQEKRVLFALNDLSQVQPPADAIAPQEKYIGPVFDESAVPFFLLFDTRAKQFRFVLDDSTPADELMPLARSDRILIGKRTGFAFYRDHHRDRKILIGVVDANVKANNYLDGPFDQLPDNFIAGDALRDSIIAMEPKLAGRIDRFGSFLNGAGRYLIAPYRRYHLPAELRVVDRCAARHRIDAVAYDRCFAGGETAGKVRGGETRGRKVP
jgi:hypothetical protein